MVVGAETTMGAFLVTYVRGMTEAGRLSAAGGAGAPRGEGELLTSAFWVAFTAGRFVNGAASARFRPACAGPTPPTRAQALFNSPASSHGSTPSAPPFAKHLSVRPASAPSASAGLYSLRSWRCSTRQ